MKGNSGFQIGTGVTSILMIFVILCLTTFGILSYTSAKADLALTNKNADYISSFYDAYSEVNEKIAAIDEIMCKVEIKADDLEKYGKEIENRVKLLSDDNTDIVCERANDGKGIVLYINVTSFMDDRHSLVAGINIYDVMSEKRYSVEKLFVFSEGGDYSEGETLPDMWGE